MAETPSSVPSTQFLVEGQQQQQIVVQDSRRSLAIIRRRETSIQQPSSIAATQRISLNEAVEPTQYIRTPTFSPVSGASSFISQSFNRSPALITLGSLEDIIPRSSQGSLFSFKPISQEPVQLEDTVSTTQPVLDSISFLSGKTFSERQVNEALKRHVGFINPYERAYLFNNFVFYYPTDQFIDLLDERRHHHNSYAVFLQSYGIQYASDILVRSSSIGYSSSIIRELKDAISPWISTRKPNRFSFVTYNINKMTADNIWRRMVQNLLINVIFRLFSQINDDVILDIVFQVDVSSDQAEYLSLQILIGSHNENHQRHTTNLPLQIGELAISIRLPFNPNGAILHDSTFNPDLSLYINGQPSYDTFNLNIYVTNWLRMNANYILFLLFQFIYTYKMIFVI